MASRSTYDTRQLRQAAHAYKERLDAALIALAQNEVVIRNWQDIARQSKERERKYHRRALKAQARVFGLILLSLIGIPVAFWIGLLI